MYNQKQTTEKMIAEIIAIINNKHNERERYATAEERVARLLKQIDNQYCDPKTKAKLKKSVRKYLADAIPE